MPLTPEDLAQISALVNAAKEEAIEAARAIETSLLTEFQKWASPTEAPQRTHAAAIRALDTEIEYLSDRVKKFEGQQPR